MLNSEALEAALEPIDGRIVDVTKVEFEVLDNGTLRWLLWDGGQRLFSATLAERADLIEALQCSGVLLRTMKLALQEEPLNGSTV